MQLRFSISNSQVLNEIEKQKLLTRLAYRLVQGDEILIRNENERDQKSNKESAYKNLNLLIINALKDPKKRVATKPKKSSIRKRLETKKIRGEIKKTRSDKVKW